MSKPSDNLISLIDIIKSKGKDIGALGHQGVYFDSYKTRFIWSLCCKMLYVYKKRQTKVYNIGKMHPEYFN